MHPEFTIVLCMTLRGCSYERLGFLTMTTRDGQVSAILQLPAVCIGITCSGLMLIQCMRVNSWRKCNHNCWPFKKNLRSFSLIYAYFQEMSVRTGYCFRKLHIPREMQKYLFKKNISLFLGLPEKSFIKGCFRFSDTLQGYPNSNTFLRAVITNKTH